MSKLEIWSYVIGAVLIALAANSISAIWAAKASRFNPWLGAVILISPLVFISFGLVTSKIGLTLSSGTIDSLLTISTILVGLFIFKEWSSMSLYQYLGISFSILGIILMHVHK